MALEFLKTSVSTIKGTNEQGWPVTWQTDNGWKFNGLAKAMGAALAFGLTAGTSWKVINLNWPRNLVASTTVAAGTGVGLHLYQHVPCGDPQLDVTRVLHEARTDSGVEEVSEKLHNLFESNTRVSNLAEIVQERYIAWLELPENQLQAKLSADSNHQAADIKRGYVELMRRFEAVTNSIQAWHDSGDSDFYRWGGLARRDSVSQDFKNLNLALYDLIKIDQLMSSDEAIPEVITSESQVPAGFPGQRVDFAAIHATCPLMRNHNPTLWSCFVRDLGCS